MRGAAGGSGVRSAVLAGFVVVLATIALAGELSSASLVRSTPHRFRRMTTANGLPQSSVTSLTQAHDGYLWMATLGGLARYDGLRTTVFTPSASPGLAVSRLACVAEGRDGTLWAGSDDGRLVRYRDGAFTTFPAADGAGTDSTVVAIRESDAGVYVLTMTGCSRLDGDRLVPVAVDGFTLDAPSAPARGSGFVANGVGGSTLLAFRNGAPVAIDLSAASRSPIVGPAQEDDAGDLWAWTRAGELLRVHDGRASVDPLGRSIPRPALPRLRDGESGVWFCTSSEPTLFGRASADGSVTTYASRDGLDVSRGVFAVFRDRDATVWIGTPTGLYRFEGDDATGLVARANGRERMVLCRFFDSRGWQWVETEDGLELYHDGRLTPITTRDARLGVFVRPDLLAAPPAQPRGSGFDHLRAFLETRDGAVWIGLYSGALVWKDGVFHVVSIPGPNGEIAQVTTFCEDAEGRILTGTTKGVARISGEEVAWLTASSGPPRPFVMCLLARRDGSVVCGTRVGLLRVAGDLLVEALPRGTMPARGLVRALYEDERGVLWAGTYDSGLCRIEGDRVATLTTDAGLFSNGVFAILEDRLGFLWMSSNQGVFKSSRAALDAYAAGVVRRVYCVSYGEEDGLPSTECNGGFQGAGTRGPDGTLAFATQGGLSVLTPTSPYPETVALPVFITGVRRDTVPAADANRLEMRPGDTTFEVDYTAVSTFKPELVTFRYRLEGLDDEWTEAGTRRTAYFGRVPPGSYTFVVTAVDAYGREGGETARMPIVVRPPFWRTVPFVLLVLFGAVALAYALYATRIARLRRAYAAEQTRLVRAAEELELRVRERTAELEGEVAERRRAEAKATSASAAKSLFLANMSHELRTPLNAVIGFAQLLTRSPRLDGAEREKVGVIHAAAEHLLGLINDVLSITKIEAGHTGVAAEPFDLGNMLHSLEQIFRLRAEAKGVALVFALAPDLPAAVVGDEGKLRQVLLNLLGNAVKFTDAGAVTLRASWREEGARAAFEVSDTGVGIDPEELPALFGTFVQTESGRRAQEGTGLGLSISRSLVRLMGGDLRVESEPGAGTTLAFEIVLPATDAAVAPHATRAVVGLEATERRRRMLVADDNRESRVVLAELLRSVGFEVREATNGAEAVEVWQAWRPRIVWMDLRMPVMSGADATRRIRDLCGDGARPAVIAVTATALDQERDAALAAGCDDVVTKPFREATIFEKARQHAGVRFVYEEGTPEERATEEAYTALAPERFAGLPPVLFARLHLALQIGDMQSASDAIASVRLVDERLAAALDRVVATFDVERALVVMEASRATAKS